MKLIALALGLLCAQTLHATEFVLDSCTQVSAPVGGEPALRGVYRGPDDLYVVKYFPLWVVWCPAYIDVEVL